MATDPTTILAAASAGMQVVRGALEALSILTAGGELTQEQIDRIQSDKIASDNRWAEALNRLRSQAGGGS